MIFFYEFNTLYGIILFDKNFYLQIKISFYGVRWYKMYSHELFYSSMTEREMIAHKEWNRNINFV